MVFCINRSVFPTLRIRRMHNIFFIFPNFPGFIPVGGDLKNLWMVFLLKKRFQKVRWTTILCVWIVLLLFCSTALISFSFKYLLIVLMPFFVKFFLMGNATITRSIMLAAYICIIFAPLAALRSSIFDAVFEVIFGSGSGLGGAVNRGVSFYANEPSHMSLYIFVFIAMAAKVNLIRKIALYSASAIILVLAPSGSLFLYFSFYLFILALTKLVYLRITSFLYLIPVIFGLYLFLQAGYFPQRIYGILDTLFVLVINIEAFTIESTARLASGRFIANYLWITDLQNHVFGHGFGLVLEDIIAWGSELGISFQSIGAYTVRGMEGLPIMPRSYLACIVAIFGIFGFLYLFIVYYIFFRGRQVNNYPLLGIALFYLIVVGLPGNPLPWMILFLSLKKRNCSI